MSRLSLNIHGANVRDVPKLLKRLKLLNPSAVLVLDSLGLAREIKKILPDSTVIFREFEKNKALHQEFDPEAWLDSHVHQAEGGIVIHCGNEMGFDPAVLAWLLRVCKRAVEKNVTVCIGNWAVGNPRPEQWPMADNLLAYASAHPENVIVGLHEYAGGVITSGLIGGYPDNAGVAPGKPGGMNLVMPANWPIDLSKTTRYHMGRFQFLLDYCKGVGIKPPRVIVTEHGFDDTSDIKAWLDTLKKTPPALNISGWKTLQHQWGEWFGRLGWTPERAYAEQLIWADKTIYANTPIEAQCIYCYGHSSDKWTIFDVEDATEFWDLLVKYSQEAAPMPTSPAFPPLRFASDEAWKLHALSGKDNYNIHPFPTRKFGDTGKINAGEVFNYIPGSEFENDGYTWIQVKTASGLIGWAASDVLILPQSPAPVPPPPPAPPQGPEIPDDGGDAEPLDDAAVFNAIVLQQLIHKQISEIERKQELLAHYRRMVEITKAEITDDLSFLGALDSSKAEVIKQSLAA